MSGTNQDFLVYFLSQLTKLKIEGADFFRLDSLASSKDPGQFFLSLKHCSFESQRDQTSPLKPDFEEHKGEAPPNTLVFLEQFSQQKHSELTLNPLGKKEAFKVEMTEKSISVFSEESKTIVELACFLIDARQDL